MKPELTALYIKSSLKWWKTHKTLFSNTWRHESIMPPQWKVAPSWFFFALIKNLIDLKFRVPSETIRNCVFKYRQLRFGKNSFTFRVRSSKYHLRGRGQWQTERQTSLSGWAPSGHRGLGTVCWWPKLNCHSCKAWIPCGQRCWGGARARAALCAPQPEACKGRPLSQVLTRKQEAVGCAN